MKKNIFLVGGGDENQLKQFNDDFIQTLKKNNIEKIYFIPFGQKNFLYKQAYEKIIGTFNKKIEFKLITNVEQLINIDKKANNIALYMASGNVIRFMHIIRGIDYFGRYGKITEENQILLANKNKINVEQYIVKFVNNGGFYYGTSAGAILAGKSLNTQIHKTSNEDRIEGLNVLDGCSVSPHYIKDKEYLFYNNLQKELNTYLIRLADNDSIYYNKELYVPKVEIKQQFIERQMEHIRTVQDNMILLEINKDKLPFDIENWKLLQRGMQHDLDKFQDYIVNDFTKIEEFYNNKRNNISNDYIDQVTLYECSDLHYNTQSHHTEYHKINNEKYSNLDICEFCCDIFTSAKRHKNNPSEYFLNNILPTDNLLLEHKENILFIFKLLNFLNLDIRK